MGAYGNNLTQAGDVLHTHGDDGGEIQLDSGFVVMTEWYETAIYYCLFGGNSEDDGSDATAKKQWCGNEGEQPASQLRGKFQAMLDGRPVTSAMVPEYQEAIENDIKTGMAGYYSSVSASVSVISAIRIDITVTYVDVKGSIYVLEYKGIEA